MRQQNELQKCAQKQLNEMTTKENKHKLFVSYAKLIHRLLHQHCVLHTYNKTFLSDSLTNVEEAPVAQ